LETDAFPRNSKNFFGTKMNRPAIQTAAEVAADIERMGGVPSFVGVPTAEDVARDLGLSPRRPGRRARLNVRRAAFAKAIAAGLSKRDAQISAGFKPNRKHANLLLRDARVLDEIERQRAARGRSKRGRDLFDERGSK
jgi:hypothetical protein